MAPLYPLPVLSLSFLVLFLSFFVARAYGLRLTPRLQFLWLACFGFP